MNKQQEWCFCFMKSSHFFTDKEFLRELDLHYKMNTKKKAEKKWKINCTVFSLGSLIEDISPFLFSSSWFWNRSNLTRSIITRSAIMGMYHMQVFTEREREKENRVSEWVRERERERVSVMQIWKKGKAYINLWIDFKDISTGARGVVVIAVGNEHSDTSSNPGRYWLHFT